MAVCVRCVSLCMWWDGGVSDYLVACVVRRGMCGGVLWCMECAICDGSVLRWCL